jgi:hypothetical protein
MTHSLIKYILRFQMGYISFGYTLITLLTLHLE